MPRRKALDEVKGKVPGLAQRPESVQRDRREDDEGLTWDERHKPSSFRIRSHDKERLQAKAGELGLSQDALAAALLWAALDALEDGRVLEIKLGDSTPDGMNYYVQAPNSNAVALVDYTWFDVMSRLVKEPPYIPEEEE